MVKGAPWLRLTERDGSDGHNAAGPGLAALLRAQLAVGGTNAARLVLGCAASAILARWLGPAGRQGVVRPPIAVL